MAGVKDTLLGKLRSGAPMSGGEQFRLTQLLAFPAILAQLSMCLMSLIDAAMVGRLGSAPAAAIGLVSTTTWIFGSFCYADASGFSVQIAHRCGARDYAGARRIFRYGLYTVVAVSLLLALAGVAIHKALPGWLGGSSEILHDASDYFLIYALFLPMMQVAVFSEASLIASGDMKVPSLVSLAMCVLDVVFNYLFIFALDLGVKGAALGTGLATACAGVFLLVHASRRSEELRQTGSWYVPPRRVPEALRAWRAEWRRTGRTGAEEGNIFRRAFGICWPLWLQNLVTRGAYIAATMLVAPLGTIAIAANSFAIIAEGFCYLPGYGMQDAATSLIGQSLGARRPGTARRFAWITIGSGTAMMAALAVLMWGFAPQVMGMLSRDPAVIGLGAQCLRIEAWAEPLYAVSIVAYGCCVGAGDTLVPSLINLLSMWIVRLGLAVFLIPHYGLAGYWVAMAAELSFKGLLFLVRIARGRWMKTRLAGCS